MTSPSPYLEFQSVYRKLYGFEVVVTDDRGHRVTEATPATDCHCQNQSDAARIEAARQTLTFGEPVINLCCENGYARWAVPLMDNAKVTGALVVEGIDLESGGTGRFPKIREAAHGLLSMAVEHNLTNAAALELARLEAGRERDRFLLIEASKEYWDQDELRRIYLREEPELLTAIKEGDTGRGRAILNRILTAIYASAEDNLDLLKSCLLELVVMMGRAAVEAGAYPSLLLGNNYRFLSDLSAIDDQEDLAIWIREMLESLINSIHKSQAFPHFMVLNKALAYMQEHLHEPIKRDDVAKHAGMSPSHFSKIMTERLGRSFSELLNQYRVEKARQLIAATDSNLTTIALECGFFDQSHLNRVFRKSTGMSPGAYRKQHSAKE